MITFEDLKQQIRELAYKKWEESGKKEDPSRYWIQAEEELFGSNPLKNGGYYIKNKAGKKILITPIFPSSEEIKEYSCAN